MTVGQKDEDTIFEPTKSSSPITFTIANNTQITDLIIDCLMSSSPKAETEAETDALTNN